MIKIVFIFSVYMILFLQTAFANAYRDVLRIPLCPSCSLETPVEHSTKGGHWPYRGGGGLSNRVDHSVSLERQVDAWKEAVHPDYFLNNQAANTSNVEGSLGCIACCGALRCIV